MGSLFQRVEPGSAVWFFRRDKVAMASLSFLLLVILFAVFAPLLTPYPQQGAGAPNITEKLKAERKRQTELEDRWTKEKELVDSILDIRAKLRQSGEGTIEQAEKTEKEAAKTKKKTKQESEAEAGEPTEETTKEDKKADAAEQIDRKQLLKELKKLQKQLSTLIINILLSSYQKRLGDKLGVQPGVELLEATKVAKENDIPIELCDRDVRITLRRAWHSMSFWKKMQFLSLGLAGMFETQEINEEKLRELRSKDVLSEMMKELGDAMPDLKLVLIDERDKYLTQKIKDVKGEKIVAVVGAGHLNGIMERINKDGRVDLEEIEKIPPVSPVWKIVGWGIPVLILGSLLYIGISKGPEAAGDNIIYWILANSIPCAIGALCAAGHPLTVIASFIAAPITSLTPVIGAGYVAAFVQAYFASPVVKEFQSVSDDVNKFTKWWKNKLLRILLVFILSGMGSVLGSYLGMYEIISNLF